MTLVELLTRWQADVTFLRAHGALEAATTKERDAAELEGAIADQGAERLVSYAEAAALTGFSEYHLRRLVRRGLLRDRATTGPTRLAVSELPMKPGGARGPAARLRVTAKSS